MLCTRIRTVPNFPYLFFVFAILTGLGGCDSGGGSSSERLPQDETQASSGDELEVPAETSEAASVAMAFEPSDGGAEAEVPPAPLASLPSPEELSQSRTSASNTGEPPALPDLPSEMPAAPMKPVPAQPPLAAESKAPVSSPPSPFSENPLREGTDDFRGSPEMTGVTRRPKDRATANQVNPVAVSAEST